MSLTIRIRVEEGDDVDPVTFDGSRIVIGRGAGNDVRGRQEIVDIGSMSNLA